MAVWPHQNEVDAFYGNPRGHDGEADAAWVAQNITKVSVPWKLMTAWAPHAPVAGIRVHRKCADSLSRVLDAIWQSAGRKEETIRQWGMDLYAGGFNFRQMRGSARLSMHSWGCAVDFDSARNGFGDATPHFADCPMVLDAFGREGWVWGGRWSKPDGMHFQAASV